jgi:tetratricopeptide (TPR) repeat protein
MSKRRRTHPRPTPPAPPLPAVGRKGWLLVGLVAAAVRAVYFWQYQQSPLHGYHIVDQSYYLQWARQIATGDWWGQAVFEQGPLYPYLLGGVFRVLGERLDLIVAAQMTIGLGTVLLTCACAQRLFAATTGVIAGLLAAVYGPLVFYECMVMKSFLEPALTTAAFYGVLRFRDDARQRWLWLSGLAIGSACLLRESHALLVVPAALAVALADPQVDGLRTRQSRIGSAALLAFAAMLPIVPTAMRNYRVSGELVWVTAGGGEVFYMAHGPAATGYYSPPDFITARPPLEHEDFRREARRLSGRDLSRGESSRYWFRQGWREILAHPARTLWLTVVRASVLTNDFEVPDSESYDVARQFIPVLRLLPTFGWLAGFGVLGIALCIGEWRRTWPLVGFVAAYALPVLLLYNFGRFRIGLMPLWIMLAAHGLRWLIAAWQKTVPVPRRRVIGATAAVALTTIAALLPPLGYERMNYRLGSALLVGSLARRANDVRRAEHAFREALQLAEAQFDARGTGAGSDPAARKLAEAHQELAGLYRSQGQLDAALDHYRQANAVQPNSLEGHFNLANLLLEMGDRDAAIAEYGLALAIDPEDIDARINLGGALLGGGRVAEAAQQFQEALARQPRHAQAHYNLANARLLEGRFDLAVDHYRQSLAIDPNNADAYNNLGQTYLRQQRLPDAVAQFRQALAINSEHANAQLNLARALDAQQNPAEAAAAYRRALQLFPPSSPQAQAIQERLRALEP